MDTRDWTIYDNAEEAKKAGVPDEDLVTGTREALEKLRAKFKFTKGSFKPVELSQPVDAVDPVAGTTTD
jgi:hypothetical protein